MLLKILLNLKLFMNSEKEENYSSHGFIEARTIDRSATLIFCRWLYRSFQTTIGKARDTIGISPEIICAGNCQIQIRDRFSVVTVCNSSDIIGIFRYEMVYSDVLYALPVVPSRQLKYRMNYKAIRKHLRKPWFSFVFV